jgi:preprotein translocase subunit SecE
VARDRQRAKQRKARRAQHSGPSPSQPRRSDVPGELEHASGEVDEFEAALVSGADGETVDDEPDTRAEVDDAEVEAADPDTRAEVEDAEVEVDDPDLEAAQAADRSAAAADDLPARSSTLADEDDDVDDATLEREAAAAAPRREVAASPGAPTRKGAGRFVGFLRASWAELQRVQWPDRRQVAQATGVVIGFVIVAGLYLGLADWVAKQVVNVII